MFATVDKDGKTFTIFTHMPVRDESQGIFYVSEGDCEVLEHIQFPDLTWENSPKEIKLG